MGACDMHDSGGGVSWMKLRKWLPWVVSGCFLLIWLGKIHADTIDLISGIQSETLPNGLKVIVKPDHTLPLIRVDIFVRAGSGYEKEDESGAAHFIEHCIFKGTKTLKPGEIDETIESLGGTLNAATSRDYAHFFTTIPTDGVDTAIKVLSEALQNAIFDPLEMEKERSVIMDELAINRNDLHRQAFDKLFHDALGDSPYSRPVLGIPAIMQTLPREKVLSFYHRMYTPQNVTVILIGDISVSSGFELARRYFSSWENRGDVAKLPSYPIPSSLPPMPSITPADTACAFGYVIPPFQRSVAPGGMKEDCIIDIITNILNDPNNGLLSHTFKLNHIDVQYKSDYLSLLGPSILSVFLETDKGNLKQAYELAQTQLDKLGIVEFPRNAIEYYKRRAIGILLKDVDTLDSESKMLGCYEILGNYRMLQTYLDDMQSVTASDIENFAVRYLTRDNMTGVTLQSPGRVMKPENLGEQKRSEQRRRFLETEDVSEDFDVSHPNTNTPISTPNIQTADDSAQYPFLRATLSTGVRVLIKPDPYSRYVSICVLVKAGQLEEMGMSGVGALTARSLFSSTLDLSEESLDQNVMLAGGSLTAQFTPDYTKITFATTASGFPDAMFVIGEALKTAQFNPKILPSARVDILNRIREDLTTPHLAAQVWLRNIMFSTGPYKTDHLGVKDTVNSLTRNDLLNYYWRNYTPLNTVVSIAGNIRPNQALQSIRDQLDPDYDRPTRPISPIPANTLAPSGSRCVHTLPCDTYLIVAGFPAPSITSPDYPAAMVLAALIGGGKGARLFREIRDERGIGYSLGATMTSARLNGILTAFLEYGEGKKRMDGKPLSEEYAEQLLLNTVRSILISPPTPQEMERAKAYVIGRFLVDHESQAMRAFYPAYYELMGLGYDYDAHFPNLVNMVTEKDVMSLAKSVLAKDWVSVVKPENASLNDPKQINATSSSSAQ